MNDEFKASQETVAMVLAQSLNAGWLRVVVNYEMLYHSDGIESDILGFSIFKQHDGTLAKLTLDVTDAIRDAFIALNTASLDVNKERWTTCDFVLDSNGRYESKFFYGAPRRINAIIDEESYFRFGKYLEFYKTSQGIE